MINFCAFEPVLIWIKTLHQSVAFTDGTIKFDSYEPNDVYRLVTSEEGFMDLRPNWLMFIKERCEQVN
jgi:hypothetical protein